MNNPLMDVKNVARSEYLLYSVGTYVYTLSMVEVRKYQVRIKREEIGVPRARVPNYVHTFKSYFCSQTMCGLR
jgi:hypothetical protein